MCKLFQLEILNRPDITKKKISLIKRLDKEDSRIKEGEIIPLQKKNLSGKKEMTMYQSNKA